MASTLFYYNHQQQHNHRLGRHPFLSTSTFSSSSLPSSASSSSSPSAASEYSTLSSHPLAGAATAAFTHSPSRPQPHHYHHHHRPSLSSWAEWPADQKQNRQLGSVTTTGVSSGSGIDKGASRSARSAARSRRCLASSSPRHSRQRPGQHMYKPTSVSASPPSPLHCSGGSNSSLSPSPGAAHPPMTSSANNIAKNNNTDTTVATIATSNTASGASASTMSDVAPRPGKRSTDGPTPDDPASQAASKLKLPRLERGPDDFSNVVKNRLQSYTRTGQACDRCKVRTPQIAVSISLFR